MRALLSILLAATPLACLKSNAFTCDPNGTNTCDGPGGRCEANGRCSVDSSKCGPGGHEFDQSAGDLAGTCVGGEPPPDGDVPADDGTGTDTPTDMGGGNCQQDANYATITNGETGHKYKFVTGSTDWSAQQNTECVATGGYLAIPADGTELDAINTLTAGVDAWVGFNDILIEGNFVDSKLQPYTPTGFTVTNGQPDDCALMIDGTTVDMKKCNEAHRAVCECDP